MDIIAIWLSALNNDPVMIKWIVYVVAAIAGISFGLGIYFLLTGIYSPIRCELNKLKNMTTQAPKNNGFSVSLGVNLDKLNYIPFINKRFSGDKATTRLLIHAGIHSPNALKVYNAIKLVLLLVAILASGIFIQSSSDMSPLLKGYVGVSIIAVAFLLPAFALQKLAHRRIRVLRQNFPEALDLLVVCCEAGLGLLAAFQRVKDELAFTQPILSDEIGRVCSKVRAGVTMQQALQELSERTGLQDIKGLNSVIVQSLKLGTGVASAIRIYAIEYRDKRLQQAEENAAKLGVKMIFPMMCCIWPSFFIVAIGPAILKIMTVWDKAF
jgi:tight adherence protein C